MLVRAALAVVGLALPIVAQEAAPARTVTIAIEGARAEIRLGELPFAGFRADVPAGLASVGTPVVYPLLGPGGIAMTRGYPFEPRDGEPRDHPHQRSFWFAHGGINGVDFWELREGGASIEHEAFVTGDGFAPDTLRTRSRWLDANGVLVCRDERSLRFFADAEDTLRGVDSTVTIHASEGELRFSDTKEGTLGFRMRRELALSGKGATGRLIDSEGRSGKAVWGKRARWIAYSGELDGTPMGVAILDHPGNLRHPTWWHARDYGLAAANPFGQHDFESLPLDEHGRGPGDHVVAKGGTLVLRHRLLMFRGAAEPDRIDAQWRDFSATRTDQPQAETKR